MGKSSQKKRKKRAMKSKNTIRESIRQQIDNPLNLGGFGIQP